MANICENQMHVSSEDRQNIVSVINFFESYKDFADVHDNGNNVDVYFNSNWEFPEEEMQKLYEQLPNKEDIMITCLSVEYGLLYHALWKCDKDGWEEV